MREKLEVAFRQIRETRMEGVMLMNDRLCVEAVGFRTWRENQLGILVTPWFMNLMLLPGLGERVKFPCGEFEFLHAYEPAVGHYRFCPMFSLMNEFADQEAARQTALEILKQIMGADSGVSRRDFLLGAFGNAGRS